MSKKFIANLEWLFRKRRRGIKPIFTRNNICLDREIIYDGDEANAYIEVWFDAEKKFGIKLEDDDSVNVYAHLSPYGNDVKVTYIIHYADGSIEDEQVYTSLTKGEKKLIRKMADEVSLKETGMTVNENWFAYTFSDCSGGDIIENH